MAKTEHYKIEYPDLSAAADISKVGEAFEQTDKAISAAITAEKEAREKKDNEIIDTQNNISYSLKNTQKLLNPNGDECGILYFYNPNATYNDVVINPEIDLQPDDNIMVKSYLVMLFFLHLLAILKLPETILLIFLSRDIWQSTDNNSAYTSR